MAANKFTEDKASSGTLGEIYSDERIAALIMPSSLRFVHSLSGGSGRGAGVGRRAAAQVRSRGWVVGCTGMKRGGALRSGHLEHWVVTVIEFRAQGS